MGLGLVVVEGVLLGESFTIARNSSTLGGAVKVSRAGDVTRIQKTKAMLTLSVTRKWGFGGGGGLVSQRKMSVHPNVYGFRPPSVLL